MISSSLFYVAGVLLATLCNCGATSISLNVSHGGDERVATRLLSEDCCEIGVNMLRDHVIMGGDITYVSADSGSPMTPGACGALCASNPSCGSWGWQCSSDASASGFSCSTAGRCYLKTYSYPQNTQAGANGYAMTFVGAPCGPEMSLDGTCAQLVCDASAIANVDVLPSTVHPGSFQLEWSYPDECVANGQAGNYWEQFTDYLPVGDGWHGGGGYGSSIGLNRWGYNHPNYWLDGSDAERACHAIHIRIIINSAYRTGTGVSNYESGPHSGTMSNSPLGSGACPTPTPDDGIFDLSLCTSSQPCYIRSSFNDEYLYGTGAGSSGCCDNVYTGSAVGATDTQWAATSTGDGWFFLELPNYDLGVRLQVGHNGNECTYFGSTGQTDAGFQWRVQNSMDGVMQLQNRLHTDQFLCSDGCSSCSTIGAAAGTGTNYFWTVSQNLTPDDGDGGCVAYGCSANCETCDASDDEACCTCESGYTLVDEDADGGGFCLVPSEIVPTPSPPNCGYEKTTQERADSVWSSCNWVATNDYSSGEIDLGAVSDPDACIELVKEETRLCGAHACNVANIHSTGCSASCYAQYASPVNAIFTSTGGSWISCNMDTMDGYCVTSHPALKMKKSGPYVASYDSATNAVFQAIKTSLANGGEPHIRFVSGSPYLECCGTIQTEESYINRGWIQVESDGGTINGWEQIKFNPHFINSYNQIYSAEIELRVLCDPPTPSHGEGTCFGDQSTLSVRNQATGSTLSKALPDVQMGDKVLAVDHSGNFKYEKVLDMRRSKSKAPFVEIAMENLGGSAAKHHLLATEHHTFPLCSSSRKEVTAMSLKPGDCLQTTDGRRLIASVEQLPPSASKETYTVVVGGESELIVVGGVVTHVLSKMKALNRLRGTAQKNLEALHAAAARITDRYKKSQP